MPLHAHAQWHVCPPTCLMCRLAKLEGFDWEPGHIQRCRMGIRTAHGTRRIRLFKDAFAMENSPLGSSDSCSAPAGALTWADVLGASCVARLSMELCRLSTDMSLVHIVPLLWSASVTGNTAAARVGTVSALETTRKLPRQNHAPTLCGENIQSSLTLLKCT